jgi:glycosyltransferase involved in cell wall biosynthesis
VRKSTPLVSVVIPLYNKGCYIERALRSVIAQTVQDFEIIVVDDGSTDEGPSFVNSFSDPRIELIRQNNSGVSVARNRGIKRANAELVAFLDADDEWKPSFLETILGLHKRFPNVGVHATAYEFRLPNGKTMLPNYEAIPPSPWEGLIPSYFRSALGPPPVWSSAVCIPKQIFEKIGVFCVGEALGEDIDMWARIALKYPISFSWKIGAVYRQDAISRVLNAVSPFLKTHRPVVRTLKHAISSGKIPADILDDVKAYLAKREIDDAKICLLWGKDFMTARNMLSKCRPPNFNLYIYKWWWFILTVFPDGILKKVFYLKGRVLGKA